MHGGNAVVPVVPLDFHQQFLPPILFPQLEPGLELDDAVPRIPQVHLPGEAVQGFQPLDGVALHRGAYSLAHRPVQVHEDPSPQQAVNLLLPRAVTTRQPLDGGGLVGGVVVDVEVGVGGQAFHDQVDEPLEGPPLPAGGHGPALYGPEGVESGPSRFIGVRPGSMTPKRYSIPSTSSELKKGSPSMSKNRSPSEGSGSISRP